MNTSLWISRLLLNLPAGRLSVPIVRDAIRTPLERLHVTDQVKQEIELLIGELCANVVLHGGCDTATDDIRLLVTVEYYPDRLVVIVEDQGHCFSLDRSSAPEFDRYGMPIIRAFSDSFEISQTQQYGTTVRAEKRLLYKSPAAARRASRLTAPQTNFPT